MPVLFPNQQQPQQAAGAPSAPAVVAHNAIHSYFKKGAAAAAEIQKYEQEIAQKMEDNQRMQRFWLDDGQEARVTFVDGNLMQDGFLDICTYREHHLKGADGKWGNFFVCVAEQEPCPICLDGNESSLSGALTIVDHREIPSKKYPGKVYRWQRKLYVAKKDTIKKLQTYAEKFGGLAGCTFDIKRIGVNSPRVGSDFFYLQKDTPEDLQQTFVTEVTDPQTNQSKVVCTYVPADYTEEIVYRTAQELRDQYGFGKGSAPLGSSKTASMPSKSGATPVTFVGKM